MGPFGVANHVAAISPRTTAKIKSVGSADDMAVDGGSSIRSIHTYLLTHYSNDTIMGGTLLR